MGIEVSVREVSSLKLAAVRCHVAIGGIAAAWKPALNKVWQFLGDATGPAYRWA